MTANIRREFADMATVVTAPDVGGGLSTSLGLTTAQATVALKQVGLDQVETTKRFRLVREGLALVANPLVLIRIAVNTIRPLAVGVAAHRRGATCFRSAQSRRRYGFRPHIRKAWGDSVQRRLTRRDRGPGAAGRALVRKGRRRRYSGDRDCDAARRRGSGPDDSRERREFSRSHWSSR